jgi:hypothetical protein
MCIRQSTLTESHCPALINAFRFDLIHGCSLTRNLAHAEKRNITDERQALHEALVKLETEGLGQGRQFLSGTDKPNLGDVSVFGVLRSIEGLPAHHDVMEGRVQTDLVDWYQRMKLLIKY